MNEQFFILNSVIGLEKVTEINLEQNQLTDFPLIRPGNTLKTLMLGNNRISVLNEDHFSHLSELTILILRENKLSTLPESIVKLSKLERFDLSNNDLSNLPYVMGRMDTLHSLLIEGNPLRTIRRDVINRGTVELLKYLRSKIQLDVMEDVSTPPSSPGINKISSSPYKTRLDLVTQIHNS
jgi:Leucine-rich repeat (LRR) protein